MQQWTYYIITFGCKVNQYESHAIREAWTRYGGQECQTPEQADILLVNSCAVTARGERDARNALYRLRRLAPQAQRILTGCSAQIVAQGAAECINLVVPPKAKALLMQDPRTLLEQGNTALPADSSLPPFGPQGFFIQSFNRARPVIKIQDGCSHRCTYCIVPNMRGGTTSRSPEDIVLEVRRFLEAGYGEIVLSGINLYHYGRGLPNQIEISPDIWDLVSLLEKTFADEYAGKARLRLSSLDPAALTPRAVEVLTQSRLLCPHLHIALQHGSPSVLRRMGRGHGKLDQLLHTITSIRHEWGTMGLGADILMGFPGETEEDVLLTEKVIKELQLTYAHVFPFSARPDTPAASFLEQIPHKEKVERAARIRTLVTSQQEAFLRYLCTLPKLTLVTDTPQNDGSPQLPTGEQKGNDTASNAPSASADAYASAPDSRSCEGLHGVSEHYAPCRLLQSGDGHTTTEHGLLHVRPVVMQDNTLLVQPL